MQILLSMLRGGLDPSRLARLGARERGEVLWLLRAHGLSGWAHQLLGAVPDLPEDLSQPLLLDFRRQTATAILLLEEYERCSAALSDDGIEHIPLKGIHFLSTLYRDAPGARPVADIDLLVHHRDLCRTDRALRRAGVRPATHIVRELNEKYQHHHHYHAKIGASQQVRIEVHWRHSVEFGQLADPDGIWLGAGRSRPGDRGFELQLAPEVELYLLLIHLASHGLRVILKWIRDLDLVLEELVAAPGPGTPASAAGGAALDAAGARLYRLARAEGTAGACFYALSLVHHLGGATAAGELRRSLGRLVPRPQALLLDRLARPGWIFSTPGERGQRLPISVMTCLLPDRWTDRTIAAIRALSFRLHRRGLKDLPEAEISRL